MIFIGRKTINALLFQHIWKWSLAVSEITSDLPISFADDISFHPETGGLFCMLGRLMMAEGKSSR